MFKLNKNLDSRIYFAWLNDEFRLWYSRTNSLKTVFDIYEILRCIYKYYAMFIS